MLQDLLIVASITVLTPVVIIVLLAFFDTLITKIVKYLDK